MSEQTPPTPPAAPVIPAEIQAKMEKLAADNAALLTQAQARADADFQVALAKDFPNIKDLSVVAGATHEEKRTHAAKLNAMFTPAPAPAPAPKPVVPPSGNPGDNLNIPPMGSPGGEAAAAQAKAQTINELDAAMKSGNVSAAYDKVVALQPKQFERVIAGAF